MYLFAETDYTQDFMWLNDDARIILQKAMLQRKHLTRGQMVSTVKRLSIKDFYILNQKRMNRAKGVRETGT